MQITIETAPPYVPASHSDQHYFGGQFGLPAKPKIGQERVAFVVYRNTLHAHADVSIKLDFAGELTIRLSPAELRSAAAMLLSAAVDIEVPQLAVAA